MRVLGLTNQENQYEKEIFRMAHTAVEDLLKSTDLIAQLLDDSEIQFDTFDAQEFLRDVVPVIAESIVYEAGQRTYRRMRDDYLEMDPNNSKKMRAFFDNLVDPDFDAQDDYIEVE